jgi:hypothetical protein
MVTLIAVVIGWGSVLAESVLVRYPEGTSRGFLTLRNGDGRILADGETTQRRRGNRLTSQLVFRFRDGSLHHETTTYTQGREFRLVSHRRVQRGTSFPGTPVELSIDVATGNVTVKHTDDGAEKVETEHLELPSDLANGLVQTLLKNADPRNPPKSFPYVAATPKPRLVNLQISTAEPDVFSSGRMQHRATHYRLKVDLGGISGVIAPIIGKQPPDSHVWILPGDVPAFARAEQPFFSDGPLWSVELATLQWAPRRQGPSTR